MFQWQAPPLTPWQQQQMMRQEMIHQEKRAVKKRSTAVGLICISIIATEFIASFLDILIGIIYTKGSSFAFSLHLQESSLVKYLLWYTIQYVLMMGIPVIVGLALTWKEGIRPIYNKKFEPDYAIELIMMGLGIFVVANLLSTYFMSFLSGIGIKPIDTPELQDGSLSVFLINVLTIAVLPAILEELVFRGFILQSLRIAGDRIAIITSGVLFGLMHGTLYQIPFAIILGIVFGYIALKTESIWMTMVLHFINNFMAVFMEYICFNMSDEKTNAWYMIYFGIASMIGIIGIALLISHPRTKLYPMGDNGNHLTTVKERWKLTYSTASMIVFIVVMCIFTLATIDLSSITENMDGLSSFSSFGNTENAMLMVRGLFHG